MGRNETHLGNGEAKEVGQANAQGEKLGIVKWFNNQKGYGFITLDDRPDIFVHHTAITMDGYRTLRQGEQVQFDLVESNKGLQAQNVRRSDEAPVIVGNGAAVIFHR